MNAFIDLVFLQSVHSAAAWMTWTAQPIYAKMQYKAAILQGRVQTFKGNKRQQHRGFRKFEEVYCLFEYLGAVKKTFVEYKFRGDVTVYKSFAVLMHGMLEYENAYMDIDFITSVPLSGKKFAQRGYNQSGLLAKRISKLSDIPYKEVLARPMQGQTQSKLTEEERLGIKDRFVAINEEKIQGNNILVIDDILTTGSTLDEVSNLLLDKGANKIYAAVFASGRKDL